MAPKFFYLDDNTGILIAANGTPLLAFMAAVKDLIKLNGVTVPTAPLWIYFWGLIFAFFCKLTIEFINDDTKERERLQHGRDLALEVMNTEGASDALIRQGEAMFAMAEQRYAKLLKPADASKPAYFRAWFFFLSCLCFLVATAMLISVATEVVNSPVVRAAQNSAAAASN